jgi:hypothetical protein
MALSPDTLAQLKLDYLRNLQELADIAGRYVVMYDHVELMGKMLVSQGVDLTELGVPATRDVVRVRTPDDEDLDRRVIKVVESRTGGLKPSEVRARLLKGGLPAEALPPGRVRARNQFLTKEGVFTKNEKTNRYQVVEKKAADYTDSFWHPSDRDS